MYSLLLELIVSVCDDQICIAWICVSILLTLYSIHLIEQERKEEGERGGNFEEGPWDTEGADRQVGNDE